MRIVDCRLPIVWLSHPDSGGKLCGFHEPLKLTCRLGLLVSILQASIVPHASAEPASVSATVLNGTAAVEVVDLIGMTVGDMDRSVEFFSNVLTFEKVSDVEVSG